MATKHMRWALLCFVLVTAPNRVEAEGRGDGLYARWDRGATLSIGAGAAASWIEDIDQVQASVVGEARLLFISAAGPVVAGRWGPSAGQYLFTGIDVRPFFPALLLMDSVTWHEFWDLLTQSVSVELGAAFLLDGERSVGFCYGFGLGLPLIRPKKALRTVWLRLGARHINVEPSFFNTPTGLNRSEWTAYATLVFDFGVIKRLGKWEPPRHR